MVYMRSNS